MARYRLHPAYADPDLTSVPGPGLGSPSPPDPGIVTFDAMVSASRSVGLDLASHWGQNAVALDYELRESSTSSRNAAVSADFVVVGDNVVGAYLRMDGFKDAVWPLNDRSRFEERRC